MEENHITEEVIELVDEALAEESIDPEPIEDHTEEAAVIENEGGEEAVLEAPKKKFPWLWVSVIGVIAVVVAATVLFAVLGSKVDYGKYVDLGPYTGLVVPVEDVVVTDEEVQEKIDANLEAAVTYAAVDREAEMGDVVNIDYVGKYAADGSEFAGGSDTDSDLELGSGSFIDGFEEGLVGASAGDVVELPLTFPEDYKNTLMAGVQVIFTVTVNEVKAPVEAVLDDAFVQENSDVETVEEYRRMIYDQLLAAKRAEADAGREDEAWKQIIENTEILGYPEQELAKQLENVRKDLSSYYGMEYEELVSAYTSYAGITEEEFEEMVNQQAKYELEYKMITYLIADKEGITWTQEEYDNEVNSFLAGSGTLSVESFESYFGIDFEETYRERIIDSILHGKVTDFIMENTVTE